MFVFVRLCEYLISVSLFQSAVSSMKSLLMHSWHSKIVEEMYWIECCVCVCVCVLSSVQFFVTYGLQPVRPLCPWNSSGQNTGVGSCSLRLGIFPTQGLNLGLPCCRWILYHLSHQGSPRTLEWVAYPFSRVSLPTQESNQSLLHWQDTAMKGFLFVCFVFNFSLSCKDL